MAGKSKGKIELQVEVKKQNQWDELMLKEGLIVVDAYSAWCGPCKAIVSSLKRLKNEIGDDLLHFATAETDNIDSLEKYRMKSQPTFLFYAAGYLRHVVRGCNCPLLMKCIKQQLEKEHKAIEQGLEREMFIDKEVETAVEPEIEEKKDEEKEIDEEEEEIAERMTRARSKHSGQVLSKGVTVPVQLEKQTTVAIIKPDAVKAGYVDDIIQKLEESGWEILKKEERTLSKEEAAEFYKQHEGTDHFEQLVEFMTSGPCLTLVLSKAGETLDTAHENVILEFRDLIGPKDVNVAKEEAPESLRAKYGTDSLMNAIHGCDSSESAARELAFFFPDFAAPTVVGKRKKKRLQRTLALIRPHALGDRREYILAKIEEAGFTIAMSKEMVLTKEQAEDFYAEHKDEDFFDTLVSNMTSGPMLALCLAREDAVEGWRELLGPKDVKAAQEEAPESSDEGLTEKPLPSLRAQFHVEDSSVNSLHGSDSMEAAHKEIQKIFPMQSTVAVIKPETEPEQREAIIQRIKEAGFKISLQKEVTLTKELAEQFYHEHEGKEFFSGLTDYMTSGTTQFLVLSREDAVSGWRALMGPTDPGEAKENDPQSLRAQFGVDKMKNVVHGSSNTDRAGEVIKTFFPEVEVLPDGTVKVPEPEKPKDLEEEKDQPTGQPDEDKYSEALGVGSSSIPDGNLSASSALDETCGAARGRLNIAANGEQKAAWCAQENNENQWIQVDCGKVIRLTKIETQGRGDDDSQRVTSYCVLYSNNGQDFTPYKENAEIKVFNGNSDQETVVCNKLATPVFTQYVRIQPKTWNEHIAMRLEVYGFDAETFSEALGVGSGSIPDGNLSASSALDETCGAARGRLNIAADGEQKAAWCAQENDENQWIQVDCGRMVLVTKVAVQGRGDEANWVTSYTLSYSHNGEEFLVYEENGEAKMFEGNTDQETVVSQWLSLPVVAQYFRLNPKTWNGHIALRTELYGRQPEPELLKSEQIEAEDVAQAAAPESEKSATVEEAGKADEETKPVEVSTTEGEARTDGSKSEAEDKPEGGEQEGEKGTEGDAAEAGSDDTKPEGGEGGVEATPQEGESGDAKPQEGESGDAKPQEGESGDAGAENTKPSEEVKEEESKPEGSTAEEKDVENKGKIKANPMVLCGPSGCGKSTLLKQLMADYPSLFGFSVSHTTRDPRKGEENGKDYHFTDRETMQASIDAGNFLESAEYNTNLYGTSKKSVHDVMSAGKVCILDIDMQGVMNVKKTEWNTNCVYIFVKPPSLEELERRLRGRNTETDESIQRRMDIAKRELQYASEPGSYNHTLINDELEKAYDDLKHIINSDIISLS